MLEVKDLHAFYGKSHVLQGVGFSVGRGEIVSLLGRNGAGRSTTVKAIMGLATARGQVRFKGQDYVLGQEGAGGALGIARFQGTVTLPDFTSTGTVDVSAPFSFTGQVEFEDTFAVEPLTGFGVATLHFTEFSDGSSWVFSGATYEFQRKTSNQ